MSNLPKEYPGPELVKLICTKLLMVGVEIPYLYHKPYHANPVERQRNWWGVFVDYVEEELPNIVVHTDNQQENENAK